MEKTEWDGGKIVEIYPCKECGYNEGLQIPDHPTLAECMRCQHLSDVKNNEIRETIS
jgi:uncharacterized paraquat-inducible protein A